MLTDQEKNEMREDGMSSRIRREFLEAQRKKRRTIKTLNDYIGFLMDVQKVRPFRHTRTITPTAKNRI